MQKVALILGFLSFTFTSFSQDVFDIGIREIEIFFSEPNWDDTLDVYYANDNGQRLIADSVLIDGIADQDVGIKYKGNSSYNINNVKNPLNIRLDYINNGQSIDGYNVLKLSNGFKDPTLVREVLSYEIAREYMPSSKATYANVYINGNWNGLYTCIQSVDDNVGRILDYLEDNDLAENTIVVYMSDQGFYLGEHGLYDKRYMYREAFRTPMMIRYPKKIPANQKIDAFTLNLDLAPTFLDYAGINIPQEMQGKSMKALLSSKEKQIASKIYKLIINNKQNLVKKKLSLKSIKRIIFKLGVRKIDYIKILDINKLIKPYKKNKKYKIFVAYYLGATRLIDNI